MEVQSKSTLRRPSGGSPRAAAAIDYLKRVVRTVPAHQVQSRTGCLLKFLVRLPPCRPPSWVRKAGVARHCDSGRLPAAEVTESVPRRSLRDTGNHISWTIS